MVKLSSVFVLLLLLPTLAVGQAGTISIYGDIGGTDCGLSDVAPGLETYYIIHSFTPGATACQFWAPEPWCMEAIYLSDTAVFPVTIGNTQEGVSIGYGSCLSGYIHVLSINVFAQGLTPQCCCYFIYPHPQATTGEVEVVDCDENLLTAHGYVGYFNPDYINCGCWVANATESPSYNGCINEPIPTKEYTWGKVKSLYSD